MLTVRYTSARLMQEAGSAGAAVFFFSWDSAINVVIGYPTTFQGPWPYG